MAPSRTAQDDDLDDLDDLLDEFNPAPAPSSSSSAPNKPAPAPPTSTTAAPEATDDFPDPEDDDLGGLDADLVKDLEQGMASLFGGMEQGGDEEAEFKKIMEQLMKGEAGGLGGAVGESGSGAAGDEEGMAELLAALQMGAAKGKGKQGGAPAAGAGAAPSVASTAAGGAPANFQDTIAAAMAKMKDSGAKVDQEAEAKAATGGDPLAAMMAQMAGGMGGDFGGEEGLQGMLDEMMSQLISRDVLYEPLKELRDKYPAYLEENATTISEADMKRYKEQQKTVIEIVAKFDEPGADAEGPLSAEEEAKQAERHADIVALVAKMNEAGSPPKEIMGEMPPGMDLGPDGQPKLPEDCCIS